MYYYAAVVGSCWAAGSARCAWSQWPTRSSRPSWNKRR